MKMDNETDLWQLIVEMLWHFNTWYTLHYSSLMSECKHPWISSMFVKDRKKIVCAKSSVIGHRCRDLHHVRTNYMNLSTTDVPQSRQTAVPEWSALGISWRCSAPRWPGEASQNRRGLELWRNFRLVSTNQGWIILSWWCSVRRPDGLYSKRRNLFQVRHQGQARELHQCFVWVVPEQVQLPGLQSHWPMMATMWATTCGSITQPRPRRNHSLLIWQSDFSYHPFYFLK